MKEATGELNMTVITIIAIAAVGALFYVFLWPVIQKSIVTQTCKTYGADWKAWKVDDTSVNGDSGNTGSNAKAQIWVCCPASVDNPGDNENANNNGCVTADYEQSGTTTTP